MGEPLKACLVQGCKSSADPSDRGARGYCSQHYWRLRKYGDPKGGKTLKGDPMRFVEEVALAYEGEECLSWPYTKRKSGYGSIWVGGAYTVASRYVCIRVHGAPPSFNHEAAHSCGNGHLGCVNKNHLSWKTKNQNEADKRRHGTALVGVKNHNSKISERDVVNLRSVQGISHSELARLFGISKSHTTNIRAGIRRSV